ncbi:hypothetical protein C8R44DRAFT_117084 [Mycena epipterygia]|nr:hypothetical protein C8R44DRAFT_117084 [Mycena epipterygia]
MHSPPHSPAVVCRSSSSDLMLVGAQPPLLFSVDARGVLIFLRLGDLRYPSVSVASAFSLIAFISVVAPAPLLHPSSRSVRHILIYFCLQVHIRPALPARLCIIPSSPLPRRNRARIAPSKALWRRNPHGERAGGAGEERHGRDRGRARSCGTRRGRGRGYRGSACPRRLRWTALRADAERRYTSPARRTGVRGELRIPAAPAAGIEGMEGNHRTADGGGGGPRRKLRAGGTTRRRLRALSPRSPHASSRSCAADVLAP